MLTDALQRAGIESPTRSDVEEFRSELSITTQAATPSTLLPFDVDHDDPDRAAALANAVATSMVAFDEQRATQNLTRIIQTLAGQIVAPDPVRNAILAFFLGVVLVYGFYMIQEMLDTRIRTSDDLAKVSSLPVLVEFP